jgi:hypothetical protein
MECPEVGFLFDANIRKYGRSFGFSRLQYVLSVRGYGNRGEYPQNGYDYHEFYEGKTAVVFVSLHRSFLSCNVHADVKIHKN